MADSFMKLVKKGASTLDVTDDLRSAIMEMIYEKAAGVLTIATVVGILEMVKLQAISDAEELDDV